MKIRLANPSRLLPGWRLLLCLLGVVWWTAQASVQAQSRPSSAVTRSQLPDWDQSTGADIFFDNAFRDGLVGSRPATLGSGGGPPTAVPGGGIVEVPGGTRPVPTGGGGAGWSQFISAEVIEDEVKRTKLKIDQQVTTPGKFAGGIYRDARRWFAVLAVLYGIAAEYDGDVRWQQQAAEARDLFARTAANAKVGTIQVFNEVRKRQEDLQALLSGGSLAGNPAETVADWSQVCHRPPLMQRLKEAHEQRLMPWTASQAEFNKQLDDVRHEAEIVAALSEVMTKEGIEFSDDDDYVDFSIRMRNAAREIVEATLESQHDKARKAVGEIGKACSECHESFRA
jgi:hypothetical protein